MFNSSSGDDNRKAKPTKISVPSYESDSEDDVPLAQRHIQQQKRTMDNDDVPLAHRKLNKPSSSSSPKPRLTTTKSKSKSNSPAAQEQDSSSDDDVPLSQRISKAKMETDSDDDKPLAMKKKAKTTTTSKKKELKPEPIPMEIDSNGKKRPLECGDTPAGRVKRERKVKNEDDDPDLYKWWEEEDLPAGMESDGTKKWTTLSHNGVLFPPAYVPHGVKMKYDGKTITLSPQAEEVASFFAALLETDYAKNPTFQKNFFKDWKEILKEHDKDLKIEKFEKCDFRAIWTKFEEDKEKKKLMTKEEKLKIKEEKAKVEERHLYAIVDGRKEKVGNFRIEPPGLFRGRGDHPKTGKLKKRVDPEMVTLNLGVDAVIPEPPAGHRWQSIVHQQESTWLATWKENVNDATKYVFLAATSTWKGQSDMQKFDKARELKKHVKAIRANYTRELKDKLAEVRQRATAMYLIDRFALRAGNEKGEEEADTVGCCSLRYEHVTLEPPNIVKFDFLGKDSIRYFNSVEVELQVYKNIKLFKKQVGPGSMIFDRLTPTGLNKYLNKCMPGLSAKVFRTYNASITFQEQVDLLTNPDDSIADKLLSYNRANRQVAVLCNHQKAASKTHDQMISRISDRIRASKYQRMKLRKTLYHLDPKLQKKPEFTEPESDLEDEWIEEYEKALVEKERDKIKNKFEKQNEKLAEEKQPKLTASDLKEKLKAADELASRLKKERKMNKIEPKTSSMTVEKVIANIHKMDERIKAIKNQATDKEENKEIALGTSKLNYIDPRITYAWCRDNNVPLEKVFSKTLLDKFRWAQKIPEDWKF